MKKIFLVFSLLIFLVSFSGLTVVFAEDQPAVGNEIADPVVKTDFESLMQSIHEWPKTRKKSFPKLYSEMIKKYVNRDLKPFKIINLKYLFLTGNRDQFIKELSAFPDDYIFKTFLEFEGKQIPYTHHLEHKKEFNKNDLLNLWKKIDEIDNNVNQILKNKNFKTLFTLENDVSNLRPYLIFSQNDNYIWASFEQISGYYCEAEYGIVEYTYLKNKQNKIDNFILKNISEIVANDDSFLKILNNNFYLDIDYKKVFIPFKTVLYSKSGLTEIDATIEGFKSGLLAPSKIYDFVKGSGNKDPYLSDGLLDPSKLLTNFKYHQKDIADNNSEIFLFYDDLQDKYAKQRISSIKKYSINSNMFAIVYRNDDEGELLMIFKKDSNGKFSPFAIVKIFNRALKSQPQDRGPC